MTKLRWDKADQYEPDPGAVVGVPELRQQERWTTPQEKQRKANERLQRDRERKKRSEQHDWELFMRPVLEKIRRKEDRGIPLDPMEELIIKNRGPCA